ncbi:MAG: right-handed parallel beta-helix repeat-containing protein [Candidatus Bathyarchaeota archaeon]|nr:right-handed parallel beta-helix repeat-containing protein [Candidatus Bathyarchaeota archaeon]
MLVIVQTLLLISILTMVFEIRQMRASDSPQIWYVGPTKPPTYPDFATIQEAINNASVKPGDIIEVMENDTSPYYEHVVVNKSLTIRNYDTHQPVINGRGYGAVVNITAPNVVINNLKIQNGDYGLFIFYSSNITLRNNEIIGNTWNFAVEGLSTHIDHFIQDIDESNTVDGKRICYFVDQQDKSIPKDAGYVAIVNSRNITAENLCLKSNYRGTLVVNSTIVTIQNITFENHHKCVSVIKSTSVTIQDLELLEPMYSVSNWQGIQLITSSNSKVQNVAVSHHTHGGIAIWLAGSENNSIMNNKLFSQSDVMGGIWLGYSDGNYIIDNVITNSTSYGKYTLCIVLEQSHNNVIASNHLSTLTELPHHTLVFSNSNGTILHHNNFASYKHTILNFTSFNTSWDNGLEGNYWSDYEGQDDGSGGRILGDGIGDTKIPHHGDNYPLIEPWSAKRIFCRQVISLSGKLIDTAQAIFTTSDCTLASFKFNRTLKQISLKATAGYSGILNITIPRDWLDGPFKVLVNGSEVEILPPEANDTYTFINITYVRGRYTLDIVGKELGGFPGDYDGDGQVTIYDVVKVTGNYGAKEP